jgi:alkanesulfonate monooxygenase SsuD/methylene tetrahydromethanopterin reductase-like flavin-dependent oxidoreductase (luciferase family)
MRLGFFTMPIHPPGRNYTETLKEDRELVLLADRLGFEEGFFGEHITDRAETITSGLIFIAWLLQETRQIKLGTGTINVPNHHPAMVAAEVAMVDHMAEGRFIMGISPGGLMSDAEMFGNLGRNRDAMFVEGIQQVLDLWAAAPPYDIEGEFWKLSTVKTHMPGLGQGEMLRPYQQPHPPIVITAASPFSGSVSRAAEQGWQFISANFLQPKWVASHWKKWLEGCEKVGRKPDPAEWRVAKSIFVADDTATAERYVTDPTGPYRFYYHQLVTKLKAGGRAVQFKTDPDMPDEALKVEDIVDQLVLRGTVDQVVEQLLAFREQIGDFGTLLYAGHDWKDPALARRSMQLMAEEVMPRVNRALR